MKRAITSRILWGILLINGIVLLLTCSLFFIYEYVTYREARIGELITLSRITGSNASAALVFKDADAAREILNALKQGQGITMAALYDTDGKLFADFRAETINQKLPMFLSIDPSEKFRMVGDAVEGFQPVLLHDKKIGTVFLQGNVSAFYTRLNVYGLLTIIILFMSTGVAYALYKMLKSRMLHEVQLQTNELRESQATIVAFSQQLEQRVTERTVQLEAVNKEMESFSYSVSHDLRAPLRAIHGYLNILHDEYYKTLDAEGQRVLSIVLKNAQRMGQLIDDLLEFSKLGRTEFTRTEIRMEELVRMLIDEQKILTLTTTSSVHAKFNIHPITNAQGDSAMIRQVWTNLISNAVKYSRKAEQPVIEIGSIQSSEEDGKSIYYVKDNGAGFDMKYYDKLFGVFQRLHSVREFEGTGVGLAICQRVVLKHGGRIWADGKLNAGATFFFTLS